MTCAQEFPRAAIFFALFVQGCTWTRFDDVTDNPPVERFETPNNLSSFGLSMTTFPTVLGNSLAVTDVNHVVLYDLGVGADPSRTAGSSRSCIGDNSCVFSQHLAGLKATTLTNNRGCVAFGLGTESDSSGQMMGLWLFCEDGTRRNFQLPPTVRSWLPGHVIDSRSIVEVATSRSNYPLVAAFPDAAAIWYYDGAQSSPFELPALPNNQTAGPQTAGRALAVVSFDSGFLVAASSVSNDNTVWLYRVDTNTAGALVGCIQGQSQFGRLLGAGRFRANATDATDDLIVADTTKIYVIAGSSLIALPATSTPLCDSIESSQVIATAGCAMLTNLNGCNGEPFATAIAAGNLDGMSPDELLVGVPNTIVRGENAAGSVFVYAPGNGSFVPEDGLYISSAAAGDRLGTSLAVASQGQVDAIFAGAPGANSALAFYCNSRMPAQSKSSRCR